MSPLPSCPHSRPVVRAFDDRFGYAKWSFKSCAEWLAWRSGISLAAREKVRTAQALRRARDRPHSRRASCRTRRCGR